MWHQIDPTESVLDGVQQIRDRTDRVSERV